MKLRLPHTLTAQFALAVLALALLIVAVGATSIYALSSSADAVRALSEQRLARLQDAQDLVQHTLLIERQALQLAGTKSAADVRMTHRQIVEQLEAFDVLVDRLAAASGSEHVDVLDLHQSSQLFRNTANIVAQLRESVLQGDGRGPAAQTPSGQTLNEQMRRQAEALAAAARQQSEHFTRDYRQAIEQLVSAANRTRWWVVALVAVSLLLAWLITRVFLGRHVVARLRQVSRHLRRGDSDGEDAGVPVHGGDEIADMARAVEQFLEDRRRRKQAEQELTAARDAAIAAQRAQATFLTNMSHELRTPLNAILGYAQLLRRDAGVNERQAAGLTTIHKSGEHLLALINDLLDLSRIEAGKLELRAREVDVPSFLRTMADTMRVKAAEKGLAFSLEHGDVDVGVCVDEQRLRQVLLNLLGNAVKFTDGGRVCLRVALGPGPVGRCRLRFEVEDTGVGIAPHEIEHIFQPFEQVGKLERRAGGTGLGLAISRQLVRMMGGELHVESRLAPSIGHGSRFWFELTLPLTSPPAAARAPGRDVTGYAGPRRRILVVDDIVDNRRLITDWLRPLGFELEEAVDGEQALTKAQAFCPDLVLMDSAMPVMDGLEATRRLRHMEGLQQVPIVAISAAAYEADQQRSLAAGADAFLAKPVELAALRERIGALLRLEWIERV